MTFVIDRGEAILRPMSRFCRGINTDPSMSLSQLLKSPCGELKAELQLILDAVVEGLYGVDAKGNATFCNDALLKMTGFRADELIGSNVHELLHHSRPDGTEYSADECPFRKAIAAQRGTHIVGEFFWRKDGTCFPGVWAEKETLPARIPHNEVYFHFLVLGELPEISVSAQAAVIPASICARRSMPPLPALIAARRHWF